MPTFENDAVPQDCDGHGTHTSGTVGGLTFGVAKRVTIHPVKVTSCDGQGSLSTVLAGVDWITHNRVLPAVVNASLGFFADSPGVQVLGDAVATSIGTGITYVVSAGNDNLPACQKVPANVASAITVGSMDITDTKASSSNFGPCVDLFAPGVAIVSAGLTSSTASAIKSGTSMSAPHVAGVVALYLSANPNATPAQVQQVITARTTPDLVLLPGAASPNLSLYMATIPGTSDTVPPTVAITSPAGGAVLTNALNTVNATITDAGGPASTARLYVNGIPVANDSAAPFSFTWDSTTQANGSYQLLVKGADANGNWAPSSVVQVTLNNPLQAAFSAALHAPLCDVARPSCKTGSLVLNHGAGVPSINSPPEPNFPNTLGGSCTDGTFGVFHANPSLDFLSITTSSGNNLAPGQTVTVRADIWVATPSDDRFDLFHTVNADANPVVWTLVPNASNVSFASDGAKTFTASFVLPSGGSRQAIRGQMRVLGGTGPCEAGDFNDRDDLVFRVGAGGVTNTAPTVSAGPDRSITLPASASLAGTTSDDGLPNPPAALTRSWTKVSGPGTVTFANVNAASTTATFSTAGTYHLLLTASDSVLSTSDDVQVTVANATTNTAPSVNAGPDQSITLPASATLSGTVTDDGLPSPPALTRTWTQFSGPGTVTFGTPNAASTTATFSLAGRYALRLTASDGPLSTFDEVQVIALNPTATALKIQYRAADTTVNGSNDNQLRPHFNLINIGSTAVTLSQVKIRYWYTREDTQSQVLNCDFAEINCSRLTSSFVFLNPARPNANTYFEIGFTADTPPLAAGAQTGAMQLRVNSANFSNYTENNDYSYTISGTPPPNFIDWARVTVYVNGVLVWGTEP